MPSASPRLTIPVVVGLSVALAGCVSTQTKNARLVLQNERTQFSIVGPADPLTSSGILFMVGPLCREKTVPSLSRLRALGLHRCQFQKNKLHYVRIQLH